MRWTLLQVSDSGQSAFGPQLRGRQQRAVLEVLLLEANRACAVARLIDELWPEAPPKTARNSVQRFVADIRRALGDHRDRLRTTDAGYLLRVEPGELDIDIVRSHRREAQVSADRPTESAVLLRKALELLATMDASAALTQAGRSAALDYEELRLQITEECIDAELAAGRGAQLIDELVRLNRRHPYREHVAGQLMLALLIGGRRVAALRVYERLRRALADEIGIEPSRELQALERDILDDQVTLPGARVAIEGNARADGPSAAVDPETTAPQTATSRRLANGEIVGRDDTIRELSALVERHRLVTLTGPGGVGKTTLASDQAALQEDAGLATYLALLGNVATPGTMLEAVAAAVGVVADTDDVDQLQQVLARRVASHPCLVVLDNAEHLIGPVADLVEAVLRIEGDGRLLVTSREHLGVPGEYVLPIGPLALPEAGTDARESPAVQLFAARGASAGTYRYDELLSDPDVVAICRSVDGLPLGIELAAARLGIASPSQIASRMHQPLRDIGRSRRDARQRSMRALLDWSWDLLTNDEQAMLAQLSMFTGWPLEAVEFLQPEDGFELLSNLASKSLVQVDRSGSVARYSLLETIKHHCGSKMDDDERTAGAERQAQWTLSHARKFTEAESSALAAAHRHLAEELPNTLAAMEWFEHHGCRRDYLDLAARAGGMFAHLGPVVEGITRSRRAQAQTNDACPAHGVVHDEPIDRDRRGFMLTSLAGTAFAAGDLKTSFEARIQATEIVGSEPYDWMIDGPIQVAGGISLSRPDGAGLGLLEHSRPLIASTTSSALNQAQFDAFHGGILLRQRRYEEALDIFASALDKKPAPGRALLMSETGLLSALTLLGRHRDAAEAADQCRSVATTDKWHYAIDVAKAIAVGPTNPAAGAAILERVLGPTSEQGLTGRADDVSVAAGVLAWHADNHAECIRLMASVLPRMPVFSSFLIEYGEAIPHAPFEEAAWIRHWTHEVKTRFKAQYTSEGGWINEVMNQGELRAQLAAIRAA